MEKTEVLMVVDSLGNGGVERVVANIIEAINKEKFLVYVYVLYHDQMYYRDIIEKNGSIIISTYHTAMIKNKNRAKRVVLFFDIYDFLEKHPNISAIHVHCANQAPEVLLAAKIRKIRSISIHAHVAYSRYWNLKKLPLKSRVCMPVYSWAYRKLANHLLGCSELACKSCYGTKCNYQVILNGVNMDLFNPSKYEAKEELQKKYKLQKDVCNFIFVGRFSYPKNIYFMLKVIKNITQNKNIHLTIVGYGEQEDEIYMAVKKLKIESIISFLPFNSNIPELLKAHDYFISPSIFEGLGIVFVEAQLMGLTAFASDAVPREADLGKCKFITLENGPQYYAKRVLAYINKTDSTVLIPEKVKAYQIEEIIKEVENIYVS